MGSNCCKVSQAHQPRPKDIPIELDVREECTFKHEREEFTGKDEREEFAGKDERETADNAKDIGKDKRGIITKALEELPNGYKVYGQAKPPGILKPTRVLEVKKKTDMSVTPNSAGTSLTHGLLHTKYDLYAAVDSSTTPKSVVFLYQWKALKDQIFVTCPYSKDPTDGSKIPCKETNITNALKEKDPEKAVMKQLKKIIAGNSEWVMDGPDHDFSISVAEMKMFWRDIEGSREIKLTTTEGQKLKLKLEVMACSPP